MIELSDESCREQVDERDTMFARMARRAGTAAYEEYYRRHPGRRKPDDRIRGKPKLSEPGGRHYDPRVSPEAQRWFDRIEPFEPEQAIVEELGARLVDADQRTAAVKAMIRDLGAVDVGCADVDRTFVYSHKGRFDRHYGQPVRLDHGSAAVFLVEMDFDAMGRAPRAEALRETARQYFEAARIAKTAAAALTAAGFGAKAHYDAHYDVVLPPLAVRAGLGELGRNNILIADRYGSRVRIGAVTTNLPLAADEPRALGALRFCELCHKCADNCPSNALDRGDRTEVRGVLRWTTHPERCYGYWRSVGTDCGVCMAVCPFSHRNHWFHNLVRWLVRRVPASHRLALWCDDLLYGRRWPGLDGE
ncbi:MAG: 4Fe-4S dicluster domain-containing protein [Deltaproteobacteria bacterium]|jgi:ferredoxin|nr:4Fe-4S dicluster domain-containing protein [Deltaproteobacteria bacterium]MBW2533689.1 4Fe-4S dicluster domain-containing protein [Deltaproteobacteria bacterium]